MQRLVAGLFLALLGIATPVHADRGHMVVAQAQAELIDINRATPDELMTLKGIGEARAKAIVKGRPYKRKDELVQKKIIPQSVYDGIKDQIIARQ
jgi:DNA uptake protein ComE-like DNA-binding protein